MDVYSNFPFLTWIHAQGKRRKKVRRKSWRENHFTFHSLLCCSMFLRNIFICIFYYYYYELSAELSRKKSEPEVCCCLSLRLSQILCLCFSIRNGTHYGHKKGKMKHNNKLFSSLSLCSASSHVSNVLVHVFWHVSFADRYSLIFSRNSSSIKKHESQSTLVPYFYFLRWFVHTQDTPTMLLSQFFFTWQTTSRLCWLPSPHFILHI